MNTSEPAYPTYKYEQEHDCDFDYTRYPYYAPNVVDEDAVSLDLDSDSDCDTITSSTMYTNRHLVDESHPVSRFPPPHIRIEVIPPTSASHTPSPQASKGKAATATPKKRNLLARLVSRLRPRATSASAPSAPFSPAMATRSRSPSASSSLTASSTATSSSTSSAAPRKSALSHSSSCAGSLPSKKSVSFAPCAEVFYAPPAPPLHHTHAPWTASDETLYTSDLEKVKVLEKEKEKEKAHWPRGLRRTQSGRTRKEAVHARAISGPYRLGEYPTPPPRTRRHAALAVVCMG